MHKTVVWSLRKLLLPAEHAHDDHDQRDHDDNPS